MKRLRTRQAIGFLRQRYGVGSKTTLWRWRKRGLPYCVTERGVCYFDDHLTEFAKETTRGRPKGEK